MTSPSLPPAEEQPGNIFAGYSSVKMPAHKAFEIDPYQGSGKKHPRPHIILPSWVPGPVSMNPQHSKTLICSMATFDNVPRTTLAEVFSHFVIPVYPNTQRRSDEYTLNATIDWDNDNQWVIGIAYPVPPGLFTHQWTQRRYPYLPMRVAEDELDKLGEVVIQRRRKWLQMMRNPDMRRTLIIDFYNTRRNSNRSSNRPNHTIQRQVPPAQPSGSASAVR
ncbi:hypothetical protein FA95DRAFT_769342 [Auriscalpium vulgare]|uniref:Uncharacterized protein n=1 Tax=Auriscalpium vulgare TaxID=40419 RepID=A0ACB8RB20_9AGAM|nr:hypothetical protein FA95DRAFT_769342 [Auriscalpium vulgare]